MATRKRKTTSKKGKTSGKRTSSGGGKRTASKRMTQKERAKKNQIWALVLFFLAFLSLLSMFRVDAPFIEFIGVTTRKLIGVGSFALPFCLIIAGVVLFISRGKPIKTRVFCAMITPVLIGCLAHSCVGDSDFTKGFFQMLEEGATLSGGGIISGYIAAFIVKYMSGFVAVPLFIVATAITILAAFDITVMDAVDAIRDWWADMPHGVEYDEEYYEEEEEIEQQPPVRLPKKRRPVIDVPLDGEVRNASGDLEERIQLAPPNVKTPAELLAEEQAAMAEEVSAYINSENFKEEEGSKETTVEVIEHIEITDVNDIPVTHAVVEEKHDEPETPDVSAQDIADEISQEEGEQKVLYNYPPISLLNEPAPFSRSDSGDVRTRGQHLVESIKSFGIDVHLVGVVRGPSVTRFEVQLDPGVRFSRLTGLSDDIALALGVEKVYIAPIPDKSAIGIEVQNEEVQTVTIREVISSTAFTGNGSGVAFAMGKDISGNCIVGDIAKLPHLLIAGTTGSGKSVCMNSLITSLLYKSSPEQVRLIMIDPKMVELGIYNGIPHLLIPVVTDPKKASGALQWAVLEMMKRYKLFADNNVRDMQSYNAAINKAGEGEPLPQIVIVIDELADLMVVARKEVEDSIQRLTQMARAAGMHLVIATQRPSVDVITGVIKSNIPSRIAFAVASKVESNIILGSSGAEKLIGKGDMLYAPIGSTKPVRIQGCFISGKEVEAVVDHVKKGGDAEYSNEIIEQIERHAEQKEASGISEDGIDSDADEMLDSAIDVVVETGQASVSMLQRRLKLGYSRAARIVDQMEARGIVGPFEGAKPRQVLISKDEWQEMKMRRES